MKGFDNHTCSGAQRKGLEKHENWSGEADMRGDSKR